MVGGDTRERTVRELIERWAAALRAKDARGLRALSDAKVPAFGLAPPLRTDAVASSELDQWFATWNGPLDVEVANATIRAGDDVAFAHALIHLAGTKRGGEHVDLWFRTTLGLVRRDGAWKVAHAHAHDSVPFYMDGSLRAAVDLTPDDPAQADDDTTDLVLERVLDAPRAGVYRAWTEADLLERWFAPEPWIVVRATSDARPGGVTAIVMRGPDGLEVTHRGVYLEVVPNERIVFTDAFSAAWAPAPRPFITVTVTLADAGSGTRYHAHVAHATAADRARHARMGFHEGWARCAAQLERVAASLAQEQAR